ncbi:Acetyltransferase (GNAT) family protein [Roseivivax jejudonensis]|uniref:Acetyltransferase (GNAT) family protein n=1 Tax=Roseivivax jejudonensis TaxID=1529041 RepID=A0A1X6YF31_9RHOB|nr:GNAT family N-acetyltransferase [Roseivivax jejudonensis]SLN19066.1 Acetyltransferase (GNAT) family protein [Roseivivax jejudonensis]
MTDAAALELASEATWPPVRRVEVPGFDLREGAGGGKRVSAATARPGWSATQIDDAAAAMRARGDAPLFRVRADDIALDTELAARGYGMVDPTVLFVAPTADLAGIDVPRVTAFCLWEPLAIQREMWAAGGIGAERRAVMARAVSPKTSILGRIRDKPGGTAFCAVSDGIAFVHALEIVASQRRQGLARWMMIAAAQWAAQEGAVRIAALCTEANTAAAALYAHLGFARQAGYHYRSAT